MSKTLLDLGGIQNLNI